MNRHTHHKVRSTPRDNDRSGYRSTRRTYADDERERLGPEDFGAQGIGGMHSWGATQSSGGPTTGSGWQGGAQPWHAGQEDDLDEVAAEGVAADHGRRWASGPGLHGGKGPKGYRRSDDRIKEDVCELLKLDAYVDPSDVEVGVKAGEVTLTGTVSDRNQKRAIEDLADSVSGVVDVDNRLRVVKQES